MLVCFHRNIIYDLIFRQSGAVLPLFVQIVGVNALEVNDTQLKVLTTNVFCISTLILLVRTS